MTAPDWIAVDWGTSNLRVWAMDGDRPAQARASEKGMGKLAPDGFEPALTDLVGDWLAPGVPVIACGMVGARQGWAEAPYVPVPCAPPGLAQAIRPLVMDDRLDVRILPGVCQAKPADVMRGEETQIAGFLADEPGFDGVLCLPGTHTKWVHVSAGEIVSFRTFMTGEIFALLSCQSVLRHSISAGWDDDAFAESLTDAMTSPQKLGARLFGLRAESLLQGLAPGSARARLSGLLLGLELAGAREFWLGRDIAVIGDGQLGGLYQAALAGQGALVRLVPGEDITLAGLASAWREGRG